MSIYLLHKFLQATADKNLSLSTTSNKIFAKLYI